MRFHIVKRDHCPLWKKLCLYLLAVGAALAVGGLLLLAMGVDPVAYYSRMFTIILWSNRPRPTTGSWDRPGIARSEKPSLMLA